MIDTTLIAEVCAQMVERVDEQFGADCTLRTVALVVEVDSGPSTHILAAASDDRPWVQMEFLGQGIDVINHAMDAERDD